MQVTHQRSKAYEEAAAANVGHSGKVWEGWLAGAVIPSLREYLGTSLLSRHCKLLCVCCPAQGQAGDVLILLWPVRSVCAGFDLQLVTCLVHQHVVHVVSA